MLEPEEMEAGDCAADMKWRRWHICAARTLNNAFVILDEAQNTTTEQMFMLLTRIGLHSRMRGDWRRHTN